MYSGFYFSSFIDPNIGLSTLIVNKELYEQIIEDDIHPKNLEEEDRLFAQNLSKQLKEHGLYSLYHMVYGSELSYKDGLNSLLKELGMEYNEWIAHPEFFNSYIESQMISESLTNIDHKLKFIAPWYYTHVVSNGSTLEAHFTLSPTWDEHKQPTDISHHTLSKILKKFSLKELSPEIYKPTKKISKEQLLEWLFESGFQLDLNYSLLIEENYGKA